MEKQILQNEPPHKRAQYLKDTADTNALNGYTYRMFVNLFGTWKELQIV